MKVEHYLLLCMDNSDKEIVGKMGVSQLTYLNI